MHLVVLYGCQCADCNAEQLALIEPLSDAALGELGVVARGQPGLTVGDFNEELGSGLLESCLGGSVGHTACCYL